MSLTTTPKFEPYRYEIKCDVCGDLDPIEHFDLFPEFVKAVRRYRKIGRYHIRKTGHPVEIKQYSNFDVSPMARVNWERKRAKQARQDRPPIWDDQKPPPPGVKVRYLAACAQCWRPIHGYGIPYREATKQLAEQAAAEHKQATGHEDVFVGAHPA
jgi:hypothetical protein